MAIIPATLTITHEEMKNSPREGYQDDGQFAATRILRCAWADRHTFAIELKGKIEIDGAIFNIIQPHAYPDFARAFVSTVNMTGVGRVTAADANNEQAQYEKAQLSVVYKTSPFQYDQDDDDQVLVEESLEGSAEFLTVSSEEYFWDSAQEDPLTVEEAPGRLIQGADWVYTILEIPEIPAGLFSLIGLVNDKAVRSQSLGQVFAAETLLVQPFEPQRQISVLGVGAWRLALRFSYKPTGWNQFYRRGSTAPQPLFNKIGDPLTGADGFYTGGDLTIVPGIIAA